jgi:hypothetical protein
MEELYVAIDQRNQKPQAQPEALRPDLYTRALWTMGSWTLERPDVFQALQSIYEEGIVYEPSGLGELHWTLLQFQTFPVTPIHQEEPLLQTCKEILEDSPPIYITFRGISRTRYGLFLCGYPNYDVNTVRDRLRQACSGEMVEPHPQDIFHSTLFRFTQEPSQKALAIIDKLVETWRNTVIATMRPDTWEFGYGTWTQRATDRIVKGSWVAKPPLWILHRGLKQGPDKTLENTEALLWDRIREGWDVEVDCWYKEDSVWLGHDQPTHRLLDLRLLACPKAWIHCKNLAMLLYMAEHRPGAPFFSHDTDEAVLTSNGYIWCYPGVQGTTKSILVMPERAPSMVIDYAKISGICSDYTSIWR